MKSNRIASIIIESNRIVRSVNRSGPTMNISCTASIYIKHKLNQRYEISV